MLLHKRWFVAVYWIVAVVLIAVGGGLGAKWGDSQAPTFNNKEKGSVPANGVSHMLYQIFGGVLLALVVAAVFAGVWLLLWVRSRRAEPSYDEYDDEADTMSVDDVEHMFDEDDSDDAIDEAADEGVGPEGVGTEGVGPEGEESSNPSETR